MVYNCSSEKLIGVAKLMCWPNWSTFYLYFLPPLGVRLGFGAITACGVSPHMLKALPCDN